MISQPGSCISDPCQRGGVLVRTGQTEGSVDLCRLSGLTPAGVICEIMKDDGNNGEDAGLEIFAHEHN